VRLQDADAMTRRVRKASLNLPTSDRRKRLYWIDAKCECFVMVLKTRMRMHLCPEHVIEIILSQERKP
jgi:hypothetical protein